MMFVKSVRGNCMRLGIIYVLVFMFSIFNVCVFANDKVDNEKLKKEILMLEKKHDKLANKKQKTSFFYLLGSAGYQLELADLNFNTDMYGRGKSGFNLGIVSGWQVRKYFAMELGAAYGQGLYHRISLNYALLFQAYIKLNNSWAIMPKFGIGISVDRMLDTDIEYRVGQNIGGTVYPILGISANYKKSIFGITYEWGESFGGVTQITDHKIKATAGIKF